LNHVKHMHATGAATLGDVCDVHSDYARERVDAADAEELHRLEKSGELQGWMDAAGYEDGEDPDQVEGGQQFISAETRARLRAQEDARAAEDLIPHGPGPLHVRIVKPDR
jgi:hypothetical protein